jgi:hypothetical protein
VADLIAFVGRLFVVFFAFVFRAIFARDKTPAPSAPESSESNDRDASHNRSNDEEVFVPTLIGMAVIAIVIGIVFVFVFGTIWSFPWGAGITMLLGYSTAVRASSK